MARLDRAHLHDHSFVSNHFAPTSGWTSASAISSGTTAPSIAPSLWVDPGGDATVVWAQSPQNESSAHIFASRHVTSPSEPWQTPTDLGVGGTPRIAGDGAGNYLCIWSVYDLWVPHRWTVMSSHYLADTGWKSIGVVAADEQGEQVAGVPALIPGALALNTSGHGIAFWQLTAGAASYNAFARYNKDTGWSRYSALISEAFDLGVSTIVLGPNELPMGVSVMTYHHDRNSP